MKFDRIRLRNFKCYEAADLSLDSGVTVIHGLNGSGKSSLLEACFFALYGAKALDRTLAEIVTIGAEETVVELWFTHAGEAYHVRRRIRATSGDARTAECVLESPETTIEGARDVRERVTALLRMDTDAFVNCAYVRQGEVNKLINASPSTRQDVLDDLLQLGKLETYRERASDARVGVGRVRDDKRGALSEIEEQLDEKADQNLHERHNELKSRLADVGEEIERYETNKAEAETTKEEATAVIEEHEQKREELEAVVADVETLRERIQETERERDAFADRVTDRTERLTGARERRDDLLESVDVDVDSGGEKGLAEQVASRIDAVREEIDGLTEQIRELSVEKQEHDGERERLTERAKALTEEAATKREQADELATDLEDTRELLAEKREELDEMADEIDGERAAFADAPVEFGEAAAYREDRTEAMSELRERRAELRADLENAREKLEEGQQLRDAGNCPECGQSVEGSPHVDAIATYREEIEELESELAALDERETDLEADLDRAAELVEREEHVETLESERESLRQLLDERERAIEEKADRIETLREAATTHDEEAAEKREQAEAADERASECQQRIAECNQDKVAHEERLETLDALADVVDEIASLEDEIETLRSQREEKGEINEERRERLAEKRERRDELQETFDEEHVARARQQKQKASQYLEEVEAELDSLTARRSDLQGTLGAVENEIEAMEQLRERREELAETVANLESLYTETENLEEMYGQLRSELRRRNIESLERMLNETFELVYENDTYSRIEIDGEYRLTVYQKDGETLAPDQLSGGERALFNLSLRCAIYRLLAEGIEGTAPMPPLILDEPTVFLDEGHVSRLVELVEAMRDLGVEQILVVSHDEELVGAADDLVTVHKDPTTNRSTVERAETVTDEALTPADD